MKSHCINRQNKYQAGLWFELLRVNSSHKKKHIPTSLPLILIAFVFIGKLNMDKSRFGDTNCLGSTGNQYVLTQITSTTSKVEALRFGLQHTQLHLGLEESLHGIWMDTWYV